MESKAEQTAPERSLSHDKSVQGSKLISTYMVTDAAVHVSQELETLIENDDAGKSSTVTLHTSGRMNV